MKPSDQSQQKGVLARIPASVWALGFVSMLRDISSEMIHSLLPMPPEIHGAAFGLRQSLDTVGAFLGPLLAVGSMLLWANDFRAVFWVAVAPGLLSVLMLLLGVREPVPQAGTKPSSNPIRHANIRRLGQAYWWVVALGAVFTLARFSEAFLVLRAQQLGIAVPGRIGR